MVDPHVTCRFSAAVNEAVLRLIKINIGSVELNLETIVEQRGLFRLNCDIPRNEACAALCGGSGGLYSVQFYLHRSVRVGTARIRTIFISRMLDQGRHIRKRGL